MAEEESSARVRRGLLYVCEHLDGLREHLDDLGRGSELDRLLRAVVDKAEDPAVPLATVDRIVRQDADARGAYGPAPRAVTDPRPAGVPGPSGAEVAFLCPLGACARLVWAERSMASPPTCRMAGRPLRWVKG
ncbi:hypothetical protein ACH492_22980 [Streptomyces sp. NPDC019443]|uniref:hypothetical protein n=1 Tax=Streptomyces sp. NPDC019443 TaxID=3365061 RepID=UPI0037897E63